MKFPTMGFDHERMTNARRALIGNPFEVDEQQVDDAAEWMAKFAADAKHMLAQFADVNGIGAATKGAFAIGHALARQRCIADGLPALEQAVQAFVAKGIGVDVLEIRSVSLALSRFHETVRRIVGRSKVTRALHSTLWKLCFGDGALYEVWPQRENLRRLNVLIVGESGTGKELVAQVILAAALSGRPQGAPAIALNCAAIPSTLAEAELFGSERGAHSAALEGRVGKLEAADGGCLFLDEVADLPAETQVKLLSVVSNGSVTRLGSNQARTIDVRYVSATSRPVLGMVDADKFRADLFMRLRGTVVVVPPLRDRREDIFEIGDALIRSSGSVQRSTSRPDLASYGATGSLEVGDGAPTPLSRTMKWLREEAHKHTWPGNVRELHNAIRERLLGLDSSMREPPVRVSDSAPADVDELTKKVLECRATEAEVVDWYLYRVVARVDGNMRAAAKILGKDPTTLARRRKR